VSPPNDERRPRAEGGGSSSGSTTKYRRTLRQDRAATRRRDGALRLPALDDGTRDPWAARAGAEAATADSFSALAYERMSDREWRAACRRLESLAASAEQQRRNRADLLRKRPEDYQGRGYLHHGLAA